MTATLALFDLAGSVALLLWGLHMVQTGIQRTFGPNLRRVLGTALGNRFKAFLAGLGVTAILQSSTATGLMVSSFAAAGLVDLVPALATMLGANVGTTLIVQLLSFDVAQATPVLVLAGVIMFRRGGATRTRDLGRVAIGLGLVLMSLHQLVGLITPYEQSPALRILLGLVTVDPLLSILLAAALTWAAHSSVAIVLLVMSFATKGLVPLDAALALVLGANLGTAINPLIESASGTDGAGRRLPVGNLVNRIVGCALALATLRFLTPLLGMLHADPARSVADFHTGFNLCLALLFFPVLGPFARLLERLLPPQAAPSDPAEPLYLSSAERETPTIALASAAREALRMTDVLDTMLRGALTAVDRADRAEIAAVKRLDGVLERLNAAIKTYVTALDSDTLAEADHRRLWQILAFITNLGHAGDVLHRSLLPLVAKRLKRGIAFPPEEKAELRRALERLAANLRCATAVFMTEDTHAARQLASEKERFRDLELQATTAHFARLRQGLPEGSDAGGAYLDLLRDIKRINTHLVAAAAYPVLERQGTLLPSRLKQEDESEEHEASTADAAT